MVRPRCRSGIVTVWSLTMPPANTSLEDAKSSRLLLRLFKSSTASWIHKTWFFPPTLLAITASTCTFLSKAAYPRTMGATDRAIFPASTTRTTDALTYLAICADEPSSDVPFFESNSPMHPSMTHTSTESVPECECRRKQSNTAFSPPIIHPSRLIVFRLFPKGCCFCLELLLQALFFFSQSHRAASIAASWCIASKKSGPTEEERSSRTSLENHKLQ